MFANFLIWFECLFKMFLTLVLSREMATTQYNSSDEEHNVRKKS